MYWLHPPSKWLCAPPPCHLGHCPLCACLGQQRFRDGAVGGVFNYKVSLSATATGHQTPNDAAERLPAPGKRIAGCLKDRRESGRSLRGTAWRFPPRDRGGAEGGCLRCPSVCAQYTQAGSWEAGQCPLTIECLHHLTPCPIGLCQADLLFWYPC